MNRVKSSRPWRSGALGAAALIALAGLTACAEQGGGETAESTETTATNPLQGETINMVVPYAPGGSYDRLARAIQPGFDEASEATLVVLNEPGAGSLLATNRTFAGGADERRIQLMNTVGVVAAQLAQDVAEGVNYDLSEFAWIGSFSNEPEVLVVGKDSPLAEPGALLEARESQQVIKYGATGPGDNTWIDAFLLRDVLGLNIEIVSGFDGAPDIYSGVLRGDVDLTMTSLASALTPIVAGDGIPILYVGDSMEQFPEANEILSQIPEINEFAAEAGVSDEDLETFIEPYSALLKINRTLVATPGTPDDVLEAYRAAFDTAINDQALIDASAEQRLYIIPTSGTETEKIIEEALSAPTDFVELLRESFAQQD
jgi:tripartite-type tricarboxylate transporter receptor subunit TctC